MDHPDDLEHDDPDLATALRRRAHELTGQIDIDTTWTDIHDRGRTRRTWRLGTATALGAAAATILVLVGTLTFTGDERTVLRTPATAPGAAAGPTVGEAPTTGPPVSAVPATATTTSATRPTTSPPAPGSVPPVTSPEPTATTVPSPTVTAPATTATSTTTATTAAVPPTSTYPYTSVGGSIVVRLRDGGIALDGTPAPAPGWLVRIDEDGPDRVRVRFELDDRRSEIRVDLDDGQPVVEITER
jgi:hypothetical protein